MQTCPCRHLVYALAVIVAAAIIAIPQQRFALVVLLLQPSGEGDLVECAPSGIHAGEGDGHHKQPFAIAATLCTQGVHVAEKALAVGIVVGNDFGLPFVVVIQPLAWGIDHGAFVV